MNVKIKQNIERTIVVSRTAYGTLRLSEALDVDVSGIEDGYYLLWDAGTEKWITRDPSLASAENISELKDVSLYGLSDGNVLMWDASSGFWKVGAAVGDVTQAYVDGSLALRDTSIAWLDTNKADVGDIPTDFYSQAYVDGSLNAKADIGDIPTDFYSQAYVDGSLALRDTSIAWLNTNKADVGDIPTDFYSQAYVDGSLNAKADIGDIPTDFHTQAYVDGSLNNKQDLINLNSEGSPLYSVDDWMYQTQSAGRLYGGGITENIDGTIDISSGIGIIHTIGSTAEDCVCDGSSGAISPMAVVAWDATSGFSLIDNAYNFVYYDGSTRELKTTDNFGDIDFSRDFTIGRVYREGTSVISRLCGTNLWSFNRRVQLFGEEVFPIVRATGLTLSDAGGRRIAISAGVLWAELVNRFSVGSFSSITDAFTYSYRDGLGGWTSSAATLINNTQYDNGSGALQTVSNNKYGVHWVYIIHNGDVHVVYGRGDYTLAEAEAAPAPADIPPVVDAYGTLVGKVLILKSSAEISSIQSAFTQTFSTTSVQNHNALGGLQGGAVDEYYHLSLAQYNDWVGKTYVDGSLNTKQDLIPDGTFLKETSLGSAFVWDGGLLDVSIEGGALFLSDLEDVSISSVSNKDILIYDSSDSLWKNDITVDISGLYYERAYIDGSLNTLSGSLSNKIDIDAPSETGSGAIVKFDRTLGYVYGTTGTPIDTSISVNTTGALLGVVSLVIHQAAGGLVVPSTFQKLSGNYEGTELNYIYIQYIDPSTQVYTVNQIETL